MYSGKFLFAAFTFFAWLMSPWVAASGDNACGSRETVWIRISAGPPGRVRDLGVHPADHHILAAATRRAVYTSFDGATTWTLSFRTGSSEIRGIALGRKELLVCTPRGIYAGPLQGPLRKEQTLPDASQVRSLIRLPGKTDRFMAAAGNRAWKRKDGKWKPYSPVFEEKIQSIVPGRAGSRHFAVLGERNFYISVDGGRSFERVAISSQPLDAALSTGPDSKVFFAVLTRRGIETGRRGKSGLIIEKRIGLGAKVARMKSASGGSENWLLWGESAWITGDMRFGVSGAAPGLIGKPSAGAFMLPHEQSENLPAAWIATENGIFRSFGIRIRSTSKFSEVSKKKDDLCTVPDIEGDPLRLSGKRMGWSEFLPRLRLSVDMKTWEVMDSSAQNTRRFNVRIWAALVWPLGRMKTYGSSLQLYSGIQKRHPRSWMAERSVLIRACRQLKTVIDRACNLSPSQSVALKLQIDEIRILLESKTLQNTRHKGR